MNTPSFRHFILLQLLLRLQGERTIYSLYHILTGKKSSQTIQDIKWYKVMPYYRLFTYWQSSHFEKDINILSSKGLYEEREGRAYATSDGINWVKKHSQSFLWPSYFNGWKYGEVSILFWKRLALYIQSLSFALKESRSFLPVFKDFETQSWVKRHWPSRGIDKVRASEALQEELAILLNKLPEQDAFIFTSRLSGYRLAGYTLQQISEQTNSQDLDELYYRFHNVLHYLVANSPNYPALSSFTSDLLKSKILTATATKTYTYLKKGRTIEDIANIRKLKTSTIEDHFVEIASEDEMFPIDHYVPKEVQTEIISTAREMGTYRLKVIKENLHLEEVDYFSIRLTLAFYGGNNGENA